MTEAADTPLPSAPVAAGPDQGRFSLNDQGALLWQKDSTNPLPGENVGRIVKGAAMLQPKADVSDAAVQTRAQEWLDIHVRQVLEPLFMLKGEGEGALTAAASEIGAKLFDHLGVMHRSDLETEIAALDPDMRKGLRSKGVRLGPVLVFLPALVKPAAVRLRALMWAIWNDKALPIAQPADGRVSEVIDPAAIDRHFYRMIGYPVFGPRAIRIDMLDRVVTDIYDTADKGVFEAKHKYAEWLGCNLPDLYAILESMGHRKLKERSEEKVIEDVAQAAGVAAEDVPPSPVAEKAVAEASAGEMPTVETEIATEPATVAAIEAKVQPVVQKFFLKRGKMSDRPQSRRPQHHAKPDEKQDREHKAADKPKFDPNKFAGKKKDRSEDGERPRKPKFDKRDDRDRQAKVYTFEGKKTGSDDNNPFAILKNLQK